MVLASFRHILSQIVDPNIDIRTAVQAVLPEAARLRAQSSGVDQTGWGVPSAKSLA